jgi:hypothetical protein
MSRQGKEQEGAGFSFVHSYIIKLVVLIGCPLGLKRREGPEKEG